MLLTIKKRRCRFEFLNISSKWRYRQTVFVCSCKGLARSPKSDPAIVKLFGFKIIRECEVSIREIAILSCFVLHIFRQLQLRSPRNKSVLKNRIVTRPVNGQDKRFTTNVNASLFIWPDREKHAIVFVIWTQYDVSMPCPIYLVWPILRKITLSENRI